MPKIDDEELTRYFNNLLKYSCDSTNNLLAYSTQIAEVTKQLQEATYANKSIAEQVTKALAYLYFFKTIIEDAHTNDKRPT